MPNENDGVIANAFQVDMFKCVPIRKNWHFSIPGKCPIQPFRIQIAVSSQNILTDIGLLALPTPLVYSLQVNQRKKGMSSRLLSL